MADEINYHCIVISVNEVLYMHAVFSRHRRNQNAHKSKCGCFISEFNTVHNTLALLSMYLMLIHIYKYHNTGEMITTLNMIHIHILQKHINLSNNGMLFCGNIFIWHIYYTILVQMMYKVPPLLTLSLPLVQVCTTSIYANWKLWH